MPTTASTTHQSGFTIIEILTVLVVIGILTSVAIPMFHGYQVRALNAQALTDNYHIYLAENQFYDKYNMYVPVAVADKQSNGVISKSITLAGGMTVLFEVNNLSEGVRTVARTDNNNQSILIGSITDGSDDILALDPDAPDGYHAIPLAGVFAASSLPAPTPNNDIGSYPLYQQ